MILDFGLWTPPSQQSSVFVCVCVEGLDSVYIKCVFLLNTCTWFIPHVSAETRERNLVNKLDFIKKKFFKKGLRFKLWVVFGSPAGWFILFQSGVTVIQYRKPNVKEDEIKAVEETERQQVLLYIIILYCIVYICIWRSFQTVFQQT